LKDKAKDRIEFKKAAVVCFNPSMGRTKVILAMMRIG
jgi:hypothetical protein